MKKFLLTSCAILSAIGVQAQTTFTQGNVTYEAEQIGTPTVQHEQKDTTSTYETSAISSSGMFMCQQEIQHEITTQYKYNATAKKIPNTKRHADMVATVATVNHLFLNIPITPCSTV